MLASLQGNCQHYARNLCLYVGPGSNAFYLGSVSVLASSLALTCFAFSRPRSEGVGRTMNRRSSFRSVVHFPDCIFKLQPRPRTDIIHPRSSSFPIPMQGPWFLQPIP